MDDFLAYLMVDGEVTGNDGGLEDTPYLRRMTDNGNGRNVEALNVENGGAVNEEDGVANGNGGSVNEEDRWWSEQP
ncbi:unnamed protein product [Cuscuta epithymum]|nr:unnamed protein product [Cuscuta epithymum]